MKSENISFNESSWEWIELLLPDDTEVKKTFLEDFMWFMSRPKKYKNNKEKVEDYVRHLILKKDSAVGIYYNNSAFKSIQIELVKDNLISRCDM